MTVATATATRIRRIRCTGCTELFSREILVDGQCATCQSIVTVTNEDGTTYQMRPDTAYINEQEQGWIDGVAADATTGLPEGFFDNQDNDNEDAVAQANREIETEVISHEIRCRNCTDWTPAEVLVNGTCPTCIEAQLVEATDFAEDSLNSLELAARYVQAEESLAACLVHETILPCSACTEVAPAVRTTKKSRLVNEWDVCTEYAGGRVTTHRSGIEFDLAQVVAKELAKMWQLETGEKSSWLDVKTWIVAGALITISRSAQPESD